LEAATTFSSGEINKTNAEIQKTSKAASSDETQRKFGLQKEKIIARIKHAETQLAEAKQQYDSEFEKTRNSVRTEIAERAAQTSFKLKMKVGSFEKPVPSFGPTTVGSGGRKSDGIKTELKRLTGMLSGAVNRVVELLENGLDLKQVEVKRRQSEAFERSSSFKSPLPPLADGPRVDGIVDS
jgi:hypothetical protein